MPIAGDSIEQKEEYLNMVSLLSNTLEKVCIDCNVVVLGDFNASSSNGYLSFLDDFCYDEGFVITDMQRLHASSYTYEQYPGGPKSWIDHVLMPSWLLHKVNNITIGYDYVSSDHFPLFCDIDSNILKSRLTASVNEQISANNPNSGSLKCTINVDWDIVSHYERENFVNTLSNNLRSIKVPYCAVQQGDTYDPKLYECAYKHEKCIDNYFYDIVNAYPDAACVSLPMRRFVAKHEAQVVGWSDFVYMICMGQLGSAMSSGEKPIGPGRGHYFMK